MKTELYRAITPSVCAGLVVEGGYVTEAAPVLGGKKLKGRLFWWVKKRLEARGYTVTLINERLEHEMDHRVP